MSMLYVIASGPHIKTASGLTDHVIICFVYKELWMFVV